MAKLRELLPGLAVIYRGVQVLLVAHGAALLSLITTYVTPQGVVPESIQPFLLKLGFGFLAAVAAALSYVLIEISALSGKTAPNDERNVNVTIVVMILGAMGSLLLLVFAVFDVVSLGWIRNPA